MAGLIPFPVCPGMAGAPRRLDDEAQSAGEVMGFGIGDRVTSDMECPVGVNGIESIIVNAHFLTWYPGAARGGARGDYGPEARGVDCQDTGRTGCFNVGAVGGEARKVARRIGGSEGENVNLTSVPQGESFLKGEGEEAGACEICGGVAGDHLIP